MHTMDEVGAVKRETNEEQQRPTERKKEREAQTISYLITTKMYSTAPHMDRRRSPRKRNRLDLRSSFFFFFFPGLSTRNEG